MAVRFGGGLIVGSVWERWGPQLGRLTVNPATRSLCFCGRGSEREKENGLPLPGKGNQQ